MSSEDTVGHGVSQPSDAELAEMDRDQLVKLGGQLDGVELVDYPDPWPVKGTRAEKRAERFVALWFTIAGLAGLAFVVGLIWWPWQYRAPGQSGTFLYSLYTPMLGVTLGLTILGLAVGVLLYTKKFVPNELAIQQRSDNQGNGSPEIDKKTIVAHLEDAAVRSTIGRRSLVKRSVGFAGGALGLGLIGLPVASFIKDPWKDSNGPDSLWHTAWQKKFPGEVVYMRRYTGKSDEIVLLRPEDLDAGAMETVFPFRESDRGDAEALSAVFMRSDAPVMLIRLRPEDAQRVVKRKGQEDFNFGEYYAYTKVCSHVGCPTSLYEQQTNRILCPCHQSQFDALHYAKPIFGPATRALAQLPITVNDEGYLVARGDFIEPVGPAFWERKS
ncbi:ubiquinol-cytochrome c reductase iron-sulfur subunit [Amycolatopsis acidiphila]|uniref:Cytochrome bc1 complex Rieske iron-sulfur subunit n=1 Tax=Amycolatopsis acidiphila TaxID=715473 RepID=A0A558A1S2_9PSEU|nr:ubiquinol-cytochrome c reductase iron-sulfur subunit [Amycolatopsis acidiphila]TVT18212.1 ubiquinol-cytochrome c reductase iron-sulfur subunit [Amycolatopsis acidiphila]UIJ58448.1 ubiquinol-cytochrome c reductase iron-sulfur subunit [Amycolatopsis acidiphila]GHG93228.1 ubiquinol-cytochrome c reductase iron-sulfur subunit [Amycolatopsis acidiphila]